MGSIVYYVACSLDGYIATADGGVAWLDRFNQPGGEDYGYTDLLRRTGALIMGANTYRQIRHVQPWPYAGRPCYVLSHQPLPAPPDPGVHFAGATATALARRVQKAHGDKDIWLVGGAQTAGQFISKGLVDEYILSVAPVLLGSGVPLSLGTGPERWLTLAGSRVYPSGIVQLHYRRA
jgi:dihydrofolate reductase